MQDHEFPSSVMVMGRRVRIKIVPHSVINSDPSSTNDEWGEFQPMTATILISQKLPERQRGLVLAHELQHAIISFSGLSNLLSDELEEAVCDASEAWARLLGWYR